VLRGAQPLARFLEALAGVDRLVLLGDVIELRQGPMREALSAARPVLAAIGEAVGEDGEVVLVPGNHDHELVRAWSERVSRRAAPPPLGLSAPLDWRAGEPLAAVARAIGPARVSGFYPGVWLRDDVYAIHGHYGDRHTTVPMLERLGAGVMARIGGPGARDPRRAEDYEATLAPLYAWIHAVAQNGGPELGRSSHGASARAWGALAGARGSRWRRRALAAAFPVAIAALNRAGVGPFRAQLTGSELRRAGVRAAAEVACRLEIDARYVLFGHTHRAGPLPRDDRSEWTAAARTDLINTGCWVHERAFLGREPAGSPYRAGFAVRLSDDARPPELVNLLD
jgi:hypothetical protein